MRAKLACPYALEGNENDEAARRAFTDAANEAAIAIRN
ncbi:MAG: hypothetical protein JWM58_864 [Rhizobium sp.]|nr:hypothetical protein [Rhizobium sp.]